MSQRLVTVATFDQVVQARLAESAIKEAGIPVTVSDENLVAMDWLLSSAIRGVKVQVWEADAERAVAALESRFGEQGEGFDEAISLEELASQAEAAMTETDEPATEKPTPSPHAEDENAPASPPESREDSARRFLLAAIFGLGFPLLVPFAVYLFLQTAFSDGPLSAGGKRKLILGLVMTLAELAFLRILVRLVSS